MKDLINKLVAEGLTEDRAHIAVSTVVSWMQEYYPVAGTLAHTWIRNNAETKTDAS